MNAPGLKLPTRAQEISEEQIKNLSVDECIRLRNELRAELQRYHQMNLGIMNRFMNQINEELFRRNYNGGLELNEAYG